MRIFSYDEIKDREKHTLDSFIINEESDKKTKIKLLDSITSGTLTLPRYDLMPSELWALARNVSQEYDKINEVILAKSKWNILGTARIGDKLRAETTIKKIIRPYITATTTTYNGDTPVLKSEETIMLLHDYDFHFQEPKPKIADGKLLGTRKIYFRYEWNETKWKNNIHTKYAETKGYKEEIPEFIIYMDWIYSATSMKYNNIEIQKLLPMYKGEIINILKKDDKIIFARDGEVRLSAKIGKP